MKTDIENSEKNARFKIRDLIFRNQINLDQYIKWNALTRLIFVNCRFEKLDLLRKVFGSCDFKDWKFNHLSFRKCEFSNCNFENCQIVNFDITRTEFNDSSFKNWQFIL